MLQVEHTYQIIAAILYPVLEARWILTLLRRACGHVQFAHQPRCHSNLAGRSPHCQGLLAGICGYVRHARKHVNYSCEFLEI
ncbi:MAG TPA: hypothetical protein PLP04_13190 [Bryobacteraceae bacterium]|mgnify:CR=1 FL=1|nr:hypothetical protein [Bryobacteraceae bacterium]